MSDDTKDWANIRIEEPVRDDARDDPRTYTEVMEAGLTFNVDPSTVRRFINLKAEVDDADPDVPDMTVQMFLESLMDTWRAVDDGHYSDDSKKVDAAAVAAEIVNQIGNENLTNDDLREQLDRIESAAEAAEERTGSIQNALEQEGIGR